MTPSEMSRKLWRLNNTVLELARQTIAENPTILTDLLFEQQYDHGIDGEGNPLAEYSEAYKRRKIREGAYREITDFHLTGEMQANLIVEVIEPNFYDLSSSTEVPGYLLADILKKNYPASFELTTENKEKAKEILTPIFLEKVDEWWSGQ